MPSGSSEREHKIGKGRRKKIREKSEKGRDQALSNLEGAVFIALVVLYYFRVQCNLAFQCQFLAKIIQLLFLYQLLCVTILQTPNHICKLSSIFL